MFKNYFASLGMILILALLPVLALAQTTDGNAPLGSKKNPIKPNSVTPSNHSSSSAKGKRGSKTNPITGSVHPRGNGAN